MWGGGSTPELDRSPTSPDEPRPATELAIESGGCGSTSVTSLLCAGVDLELDRGRFLTVFGPNGAGKTTLIKVLSTQIKPSRGLGPGGRRSTSPSRPTPCGTASASSRTTRTCTPNLTRAREPCSSTARCTVSPTSTIGPPRCSSRWVCRAAWTTGSRTYLARHAAAPLHRPGAPARARHHVPRRTVHRPRPARLSHAPRVSSRRCTRVERTHDPDHAQPRARSRDVRRGGDPGHGTHGLPASRSRRSTGRRSRQTYFDHVGKDYRWDS